MQTAEVFYDGMVEDYDFFVNEFGWNGPQNSFAALFPFLKKNDLVVEFGAGTGACAALLIKAGCRYKGLEISSGMIREARDKLGPRADLIKHDLFASPYPLGSQEADHVVCTGTSHLVPDAAVIQAEAARSLKSTGMLFVDYIRIATPEHVGIAQGLFSAKDVSVYFHDPQAFEAGLGEHGFDVVRRTTYYLHEEAIGTDQGRLPLRMYFQGLLCKKR